MSTPNIPNINPEISIVRDDAVNIIAASIAMEELALAHILNAEGEKLQYILGTLEGSEPGEITICDIMAVSNSVHKMLRDVIKEEMLLQLKLEDTIELAENAGECQLNIRGRLIWRDGNNIAEIRPANVEVTLLRDGEPFRTISIDSMGDGAYAFTCLPVWRDSASKYTYRVDEAVVPTGYSKTTDGYNIINTLNNVTISGVKTWIDNDNVEGERPQGITLRLFQNDREIDSLPLDTSDDTVNTIAYTFGERPYLDDAGLPYAYRVEEDAIANYTGTITGYNILNTYVLFSFSFTKTNASTAMSLKDASFELLQNGIVQSTAVSDENGLVSFKIKAGSYQLQEAQPPAGFMDDSTVYQVAVASDGNITVDGMPATEFGITNQPTAYGLKLARATAATSAYMAEPNTTVGTGGSDLYMVDKIIITPEIAPVTVKWDYGVRNVDYFTAGGGNDVTAGYAEDGIPVFTNSACTVYVLFANGHESATAININNIRDGSLEMPYLLIDYTTAAALEPSVTGISQFIMDYMQGGGVKLAQHYELFENIDMTGKAWLPLGTVGTLSPYPVIEGFSGSFEGNEHMITGLDLSYPGAPGSVCGLFRAVIDGAVIQNFNISYRIACPGAAGLAASVGITDGGTVLFKNVHVIDSAITRSSYAGGVVSHADVSNGSLIIESCSSNNLDINNHDAAGGIIGSINQASTGTTLITNCNSTGNIFTDLKDGAGIVGQIVTEGICSITNCASGMTLESLSNLGGIIGSATQTGADSSLMISSCYNYARITGAHACGGIAGLLDRSDTAGNITVENCYNTGNIEKTVSSGANNIGGLIGQENEVVTLLNSYNVGDVLTEASTNFVYLGGISGGYCSIKNCAAINAEISNPLTSMPQTMLARISTFNLYGFDNNVAYENMKVLINGTQKSPLSIGSSAADGMDVSAAEIKTQALYETDLGWNFTDVWSFGNGAYTLPVLRGIPLELQPDILPSHLA